MFSGPQRGVGEPGAGGGVAETQAVVGRQLWWWGRAEVVLGAPPLAGSRWGQIFGESVAMGTGRFLEKGSGRGAEDASQSPPRAAITMTTSTILGRGRRGGVSDGGWGPDGQAELGEWKRGLSPKAPAATDENRVSQERGRPAAAPPDSLLLKFLLSVLAEDIPLCFLPFHLPASSFSYLCLPACVCQ